MIDGGAEEHEELVALLDDLARAGRDRVVGARLGLEGDDVPSASPTGRLATCSWPSWSGTGRPAPGQGPGWSGAYPGRTCARTGHRKRWCRRRPRPSRSRRPCPTPTPAPSSASGSSPCSWPGRPASPRVPRRRSACSRCRPPRTPTRRAPRGCRSGQGRPRGGAQHHGLGRPCGTSQPGAHPGTSRHATWQPTSPWASGSAQTMTAAVARGRWATSPGRGPWDQGRARRSSRPIPGRRGSSSPSRGTRICRSGPSGSGRHCRPAPSEWR